VIAFQLIKVLNGIFDPPPQHPAVPWTFVGTVVIAVAGSAVVAAAAPARWAARVDASHLRDV
jgi:putative ABC transport system permease protein